MSNRKHRVEHALRDVLSELIRREVRDPRVKAVPVLAINRVELNVDLSVATVYVAALGVPDDPAALHKLRDEALEGLTRAAGYLRGPAGRQLNLNHPPELRFVADHSADMNERITAALREDAAKAQATSKDDEPEST